MQRPEPRRAQEGQSPEFREQLRTAANVISQWDPYRDFPVMPCEIIIAKRKALAALRNLQTELDQCRH